jgi:hypothetical protein
MGRLMTYLLTCPTCGKTKRVPESRAHLKHCSRKCYNESLLLDEKQVKRMIRLGMTRRAMAAALEMPYVTLRWKLKNQGLNDFTQSRYL